MDNDMQKAIQALKLVSAVYLKAQQNVVANEYDNVSVSIKNEFDNDFANEISKLLGLTIGTGSGASAASNTTGTTAESETSEWKWNPNLTGEGTNQNTSSSTADSGTQNTGLVSNGTQNSGLTSRTQSGVGNGGGRPTFSNGGVLGKNSFSTK